MATSPAPGRDSTETGGTAQLEQPNSTHRWACGWPRRVESARVGGGMIDNYSVEGRTTISVPDTAVLVNVNRVSLTSAVQASASAPASTASAPARSSGASGVLPAAATPCPGTRGQSSSTNSALASEKTPCPFAEAVRIAYGASEPPSQAPLGRSRRTAPLPATATRSPALPTADWSPATAATSPSSISISGSSNTATGQHPAEVSAR